MSEERAFAVEIARAAGRCTLEYFGRDDLQVEQKENETPVTAADRAAEKLLRARIEERYPEDGVVGEEYGVKESTNGRRWILDPVDGTKSFERGVPLYGVLVGFEVNGVVDVGVIHMPALGEEVHARRGDGATWVTGIGTDAERARPARVSTVATPEAGLVCMTSAGGFARIERPALFLEFSSAFRQMRGWGDCYAHLLVATGRAEAAIDPILEIWDAAPLQVCIEEAGGRFTDRDGRATHHGRSGISTNGLVHDAVMRRF
ncbi:MAG: inositol monophosphatase family protein [Planctomycetota bacterium]